MLRALMLLLITSLQATSAQQHEWQGLAPKQRRHQLKLANMAQCVTQMQI
jgi:hypothetical protein